MELDKSGYVAKVLVHFSKAYDCLHDLNIAKLEAYCFTKCMHSCDRAHNVHANGVTRTQKFGHGIDFTV